LGHIFISKVFPRSVLVFWPIFTRFLLP
jgi:hypothetical protein